MAKRSLQQKRGWVEFKGLQFAKPYMDRPELLQLIHAFFAERGLKVGSSLVVVFTQVRKPSNQGGEPINGAIGRTQRGLEAIVHVRTRKNKAEFVRTLCHELDHVCWEYEGRKFDHTLEYGNRPHEVRARRVGEEWGKRYAA